MSDKVCTDVIVEAMEKASNMSSVIVIFRMNDVNTDKEGVGWETNMETCEAIGMMEMVKHGLLVDSER